MTVLLVRHAHALPRSSWEGDDFKRTLSSRGYGQAAALAAVLGAFEPGRVLSSPYVRCLETVRPAADALDLGVEAEPGLEEGAATAATELVRSLAASDVVICSHGDVIPEVLATLAGADNLDLGKNPRCEKASIWVLSARRGRFAKASYVRPPGH